METDKIYGVFEIYSISESCCNQPECNSARCNLLRAARAQLAALTEQQAETRPTPTCVGCEQPGMWYSAEAISGRFRHRSKDQPIEILCYKQPTETRMPCGHWTSDLVEGAHTPHEGDTDHRCAADCLPSYCRSCKQQAEAVAQARLDEFDFIVNERPIDPVYWDLHRRRKLEMAVKEAGR